MERQAEHRRKQGNTETSGGEPQPGAEETGHVKEDEGKREESGERTLRLESRKRGRRNRRMRHRQKWRGSGERRNTYRSLRQYLCRTPRIQTPHPIETPEEGRTEVPGTPREQAEGEE